MCVCVCVYLLRTCSINKHAKDAEYVELCKLQEFLSFRFCVGLHIVHIPNANPPGQEMSSCSWHSLINTLSCYRALRKSNIHLLNPNDWDTKSMGGKVTSQGRSSLDTNKDAENTRGLVYPLSRAAGPCPVQLSSNKPADTIKIKEVTSRPGKPAKWSYCFFIRAVNVTPPFICQCLVSSMKMTGPIRFSEPSY